VLDAIGFDADLMGVELVVTGEGSWDEQSRHGKAPAEVLRRANEKGVPAAIVAGRVASRDGLAELGVRSVTALVDLAGSPEVAMRDAERLLEAAGADLGRTWRW
jgi:glycerate kinase